MKFFVKSFLSKCKQIRRKVQICLYLLKKSLTENFIFYAVQIFERNKANLKLKSFLILLVLWRLPIMQLIFHNYIENFSSVTWKFFSRTYAKLKRLNHCTFSTKDFDNNPLTQFNVMSNEKKILIIVVSLQKTSVKKRYFL